MVTHRAVRIGIYLLREHSGPYSLPSRLRRSVYYHADEK